MQNEGEEGQDENPDQNEEDSGLRDEGDETTEDIEVSEPEPHVSTAGIMAHISRLRFLDDVEDLEPPWQDMEREEEEKKEEEEKDQEEEEEKEEEEEEMLTILDLDHPLVRKYQDGMTARFRGRMEQLNLELKEKEAVVKADDQYSFKAYTEFFKVQKQLSAKKSSLEEGHCALAEAKTKCLQLEDQQEETKSRHSIKSSQHSQIMAQVSKLQTDLEKVVQYLVFTQEVSEDLHSKVKTMNNIRSKLGAEKTQAEEQKLKQDLFVDRLTKDVEKLTEQIATYEAQIKAQAEEKCAVREMLYESEMVIETLFLAHKQLLQQWNTSLIAIRKRDEAFSAMQKAERSVNHQLVLLDREIEGAKKSLTALEEENETLTMQLNWSEMECTTHKKLVSQKEASQEALQANYNSCSRTLYQTEQTLAKCMEEIDTHQAELNNQRRRLEKETALRLDLESKIMTHMQQKLSHDKAAQHSRNLMDQLASQKRAKISLLEQLENELLSVRLESQQVDQQVILLTQTHEALEEELAKKNKLLTATEAHIKSLVQLVKQKGQTLIKYHNKLAQIRARTGREDLSPLQLEAEEIMTRIEEIAAHIKYKQELWMKHQGVLVNLTQEMENKIREMSKLQTEYIVMEQGKIRFKNQKELEDREEAELDKTMMMLDRDLQKLSSLVSEKKQLSEALEQDNALMETEYLQKLKEAEWESVNMQMNLEKVQEENERLLNALMESEQQFMLWERKAQLLKETFSTVDTGQEEMKKMKEEIRRMEVQIEHLKKQQESLIRESEGVVETWENITLRRDTMVRTSHNKNIKGELRRSSEGLQRKIWETCNYVKESGRVYKELEKTQACLTDRLVQEKHWLTELFNTIDNINADLKTLQDTKEIDFFRLVTLQTRSKKLRALCQGKYKASPNTEVVEAGLHNQMEFLETASTIVQHECEEVPEHRGALRKVLQTLAASTQAL